MNEEKYDGPVIHFNLSIGYPSADHNAWVKAPSNWSEMTERTREKFINEAAEQYANEYIEYGAVVYDSPDVARKASRYSDDQLESWYYE
jgi:hypothetical protein